MDLLELIESSSSSLESDTESEDSSELLSNVISSEILKVNPKNTNFVEETVPLYSEEQFIQHFRYVIKPFCDYI